MKVLFYSPVNLKTGGGCERWHCDITNSLVNQFKYDVEIVTGNLGDNKWSDEYLNKQLSSIKYTKLNFKILFGVLFVTPSTFISLLKKIQKADVVHFIFGFMGQDILMLVLKVLTGKRIVVGHHAPIFHGSKVHNWYISHVSRYLMSCFDAHQTLNSSDKKFFESHWHIKNVHFIPSGIRVEKFINLKKDKHSTLNFISVGRYEMQKGYDLLLEAISIFNQKHKNNKAVFQFAGGGSLKAIIQDASRKFKNVVDLGYVPYEKIPKVYSHSDVYLLPSREEPFGLVLIEAWAAQLPVLATRSEGPKDMLKASNGIFINAITPKSIYEGINTMYNLWETGKLLKKFTKNALKKSALSFSIDLTASRMRQYLFYD